MENSTQAITSDCPPSISNCLIGRDKPKLVQTDICSSSKRWKFACSPPYDQEGDEEVSHGAIFVNIANYYHLTRNLLYSWNVTPNYQQKDED